ncbi:restriction endonuclease subunit S [Ruminococcus callidus]|uniref:restriction endonuclease subunit S n=1 Tax=Ruminococcus callidus TaxID=40519 RepID=UPI0023F1F9FE|nr:restriction endonuclease subunit S [Ruminococcus callidus]
MAKKTKTANLSIEEKLEQALIVPGYEPYKIPDNWCWTQWKMCGEFVAGSAFKEKYQGIPDLEIPFYKVGSLKYADNNGLLYDSDNTIDEDIRGILKAKLIPSYSVLFAKIGEAIRLNRRALNYKPCCIDNNLMAFIADNNCYFKYVLYWSMTVDFYTYTNATTVPAIRKTDLESIPFPVAPLAEQQRIVERIESLFSKLDEAKEKAQEVINSFETRKAAILHKAFSGELTAKWREENGVGIESWENRSINDICHSLKYGTSKKSKTQGSVIVIRMGNLQQGEIDWSDLAYTDDKEDIEKYRLYPGDVLFNRTNSAVLVGKTSIYRGEFPAIYAGYLIKLDYKHDEIIGDYLNYALNTPAAKEYCNNVKTDGVNQSNINAKKIGAFVIPVASINEQQVIVEIISSLLKKENESKQAAEVVIDQIYTMKKAILARAFRGELGTNDPKEESAVELLKQILTGE